MVSICLLTYRYLNKLNMDKGVHMHVFIQVKRDFHAQSSSPPVRQALLIASPGPKGGGIGGVKEKEIHY